MKKAIKSGSEKKPENTKNRKESLRKTSWSEKDKEPIIKNIIPITNSPTTSAKDSNIIIASSEGFSPKASEININLNSGENNERSNGVAWIKIRIAHIEKMVFIFMDSIFS